MALNDLEKKRWERDTEKFLARRRPPPHIRPELDIGYRISNQSVEIFEIRPHWQHRDTTLETPVAKATFVRSKGHWRVFWMRADLKWHRYEPSPEVSSLEDFLDVVDKDEYCCFFG
jgi:Protein of unknown function (DUF3024)